MDDFMAAVDKHSRRTVPEDTDFEPKERKKAFIQDIEDMPPAPAHVYSDAVDVDLWFGPRCSVPVSFFPAGHVDAHLRRLTCTPNADKAVAAAFKAKSFCLGEVCNGRLYMPMWYGWLAFPKANVAKQLTTRGLRMRDEVAFTGSLFEHPPQKQANARVRQWAEECGERFLSVILTLPCGYGKTVTFLSIMCHFRRVTLVLTHKLPLLDQWIAEARMFCGNLRVGYIRADEQRIEGVDLIVASVHSLSSHMERNEPYVADLMKRVGLVCLDEGHHAVASTFSTVLARIPAKFRIVLTATPRRKDGLQAQLQWVAGPVLFRAFRRVGDVHVVSLQYKCPAFEEVFMRVFAGRGRSTMVPNRAAMINNLVDDAEWNAIAVAVVKRLLPQGRRILITVPRVEQIHKLASAVESLVTDATDAVRVFVPERAPAKRRRRAGETVEEAQMKATEERHAWEDSGPHGTWEMRQPARVGLVLQGMDTLERELAYMSRVVITTSVMMEEGISCKVWDTLLDLDCLSDPEQVVGRILRHCPAKRVPLVIDAWIDESMFKGLFWKRYKYYKDEEFSVRRVEVSTASDVPEQPFWAKYDYAAPAMF